MEFGILGPLEVRADGRPLELGGPRQQRVLAALLLQANLVVPLRRLVEAAWDDPPASAEHQVRNRIGILRGVLTRFGGLIDTADDGYRIRVGPGELDADEFDRLTERGRAAGDPQPLRTALSLWRGPALDGLGGRALAADAARLEEQRLGCVEDCLALELAAGRDGDLVAELRALVDAHPLRERFVAQLITALHRSGRPDEARAVYAAAARRLADELGIDPGIDVRRAYGAVTAAGPLPAAPLPSRPSQLPANVSGFVGRAASLAWLDALSAERPGRRGGHLGHRRHRRGREDRAGRALGPPGAGRLPRRPAVRQPARLRPDPAGATDRRSRRSCEDWTYAGDEGAGRARRGAPGCTAPRWSAGACWSCSTTPAAPTRSARCCPPAPAAWRW